jgi:hypothetical protein
MLLPRLARTGTGSVIGSMRLVLAASSGRHCNHRGLDAKVQFIPAFPFARRARHGPQVELIELLAAALGRPLAAGLIARDAQPTGAWLVDRLTSSWSTWSGAMSTNSLATLKTSPMRVRDRASGLVARVEEDPRLGGRARRCGCVRHGPSVCPHRPPAGPELGHLVDVSFGPQGQASRWIRRPRKSRAREEQVMTTSESRSSGQVTATGPLTVSAANPRYFTAAAGDTAEQKAGVCCVVPTRGVLKPATHLRIRLRPPARRRRPPRADPLAPRRPTHSVHAEDSG